MLILGTRVPLNSPHYLGKETKAWLMACLQLYFQEMVNECDGNRSVQHMWQKMSVHSV